MYDLEVVRDQVRAIWENEPTLLKCNNGRSSAELDATPLTGAM